MRKLAIQAAFCLRGLLTIPAAYGAPMADMYSANFWAHGDCNGQDSVANNEFPPWEPGPIHIVGAEIVVNFTGDPAAFLEYAFLGNSVSPDIMIWIGPGQTHASHFFPQGMGMPFGPVGANPHVDMHVNCVGAAAYQGFETIYYTRDR